MLLCYDRNTEAHSLFIADKNNIQESLVNLFLGNSMVTSVILNFVHVTKASYEIKQWWLASK